jgi:murein DD-endopeptidase MepM/ murein hydrolase activator NlpD
VRAWRLVLVAIGAIALGGCPPPPREPREPDPQDPEPQPMQPDVEPLEQALPAALPDKVVWQSSDFIFDGGRIDLELRQRGDHLTYVARDRYRVPIVMAWTASNFTNIVPDAPPTGVTVLPAADKPNGDGAWTELLSLQILDERKNFHPEINFTARFGNPTARPQPYAYALPFGNQQQFSILQGFHGQFSHRGSNEYAIDFACPVATSVLAARAGIVVAKNESAQGSGITAEYLDLHRVNFVLVLHDDGTLGEYMHLSPSGVLVEPGQRVLRGTPLALSGNTGYSSTPHLHFQVMTAATDGVSQLSFPFEIAVAPQRSEQPVQGRTYTAWE